MFLICIFSHGDFFPQVSLNLFELFQKTFLFMVWYHWFSRFTTYLSAPTRLWSSSPVFMTFPTYLAVFSHSFSLFYFLSFFDTKINTHIIYLLDSRTHTQTKMNIHIRFVSYSRFCIISFSLFLLFSHELKNSRSSFENRTSYIHHILFMILGFWVLGFMIFGLEDL